MVSPVFIISFTAALVTAETGITKRDGETVTLHVNKTVNPKSYVWTYGQQYPIEAITIVSKGEVTRVNGTRFGNRLHLHKETGSISISNLSISDGGIFLAQLIMETGTLMETFNLTVQDNFVLRLNVLEGNNVTLDSVVRELQQDHTVIWTRGPDFGGKLIAQWKNFSIYIEESFVGVLQLNPHTGSLTIIRVTQSQSDYYCVQLLLGKDPHIRRQYFISVFEPVARPLITSAQANTTTANSLYNGNCSIVCTVKNGPDVTLSWYRGETEINQTSNKDVSTNVTLPLEIQSEDEVSYSCVAANPVSRETVTVNSTQWCPRHRTDAVKMYLIIGGCVGSVALVALVVAPVVCWFKRQNGGENSFCLRYSAERTPSQDNNDSEGGTEAAEHDGLLS